MHTYLLSFLLFNLLFFLTFSLSFKFSSSSPLGACLSWDSGSAWEARFAGGGWVTMMAWAALMAWLAWAAGAICPMSGSFTSSPCWTRL